MANLLLIDDDASLLDALRLAFEDAGHAVDLARDGQEGLDMIRARLPSCVVSDVNMPRLDGFTLCRRLREEKNAVPLILLTSRDGEIDQALGLELGADDYVTKPFSTRVLIARVNALIRRDVILRGGESATSIDANVLFVGDLSLDLERLEAKYREVSFTVTVTEFRILEQFAKRPGIVFTRERLLELVRGDDSVVADRIIDTYVRRLRRKLERIDPAFDRIETVIGAGYKWRSDGA